MHTFSHGVLTLTEWLWKSVTMISLFLLTAAKCGPSGQNKDKCEDLPFGQSKGQTDSTYLWGTLNFILHHWYRTGHLLWTEPETPYTCLLTTRVVWDHGGAQGSSYNSFFLDLTIRVPANCLSPLPRLPNLVMSFPVSWKMKTVHALLSTTITWPFWSTETPFGPISLPEPSLA